jgi:hypothetical protein
MAGDEGVLGTMTVHLYMRVGDSGLTEVGTAEVDVGPRIKMDVVLADMFESAAKNLRAKEPRG